MSVDFVAYQVDRSGDTTCYRFAPGTPELNVANVTARAMLTALGIDGNDLCSSVPPEEIPAIRRRILVLIQSEASVAAFAVPGSETPATPTLSVVDGEGTRVARRGTCAVIDCGVPVERLLHRLKQLDQVADFAHRGGFHLGWA